MALKLYPLGIQTFERIRKENKLYIDKTEYVYRLTHTSGTYFFLGRPRRFGKSLFLTTLQSYFEGKKDLFNGLASWRDISHSFWKQKRRNGVSHSHKLMPTIV